MGKMLTAVTEEGRDCGRKSQKKKKKKERKKKEKERKSNSERIRRALL
jgi:hypothetical protein